jgi:hypothetical protein
VFVGPIVDRLGWTSGDVGNYTSGVHGWLLWPGVTLMVFDSLVNLAYLVNWKKTAQGFFALITSRFLSHIASQSIWWIL